ncbi:MAG: T9SS type A sorting domain-containing protein [Bacteroidetes bacterium]|nr:T9SS type A sorting domain-containing protein [Bacteroidota bacterium]
MKRILLTIMVIIAVMAFANSQSFYITVADTLVDSIITVHPSVETSSKISFKALIHNSSNNGANVKVIRNEILMLEGTSSLYRWGGDYYDDTTNLSLNYIYIPAGGSSSDSAFATLFNISDSIGISSIEYTFFNVEIPDENVKIIVNYDSYVSPASIDEEILRNIFVSDIYPNPSSSFVDIDYDIPGEVKHASVKIFNIIGSVIKEKQIDQGVGKLRINVSDLSGGIYFYSMFLNDELYRTDKLIIR